MFWRVIDPLMESLFARRTTSLLILSFTWLFDKDGTHVVIVREEGNARYGEANFRNLKI